MTLQLVTNSAAATGAVNVGVPDVVGLTQEQAQVRLVDFRVDVQKVEVTGPEGTVYTQVPEAPRLLARGSQVRIFIITNPASSPDVLARLDALDDAISALGTSVEGAADTRQAALVKQLQALSDQVSALGNGQPQTGSTGSTAARQSK